jgi:hypothetical protein
MPTIKEIRAQFPQYDDWNDAQLATALHKKFYADIPRDQFNKAIGFEAPTHKALSFEEGQALLDQERQGGAGGALGAGLTGAVEGVPVVGPLVMGGAQRAAARISSLIDGESYDANLDQARRATVAAQAAHPNITTAGNVVGAVGGTLPLIAAAPAAFGAGSGSMVAKTGASLISGGILGGADAAVRSGGDIDATKIGTGFGAATGVAGPIAGKAIGAGAQKIWNALTNRSAAQAAGTTAKTIAGVDELAAREGLDAAGVQARLEELGPRGLIMDLGPGLQGRAGGIAATPGEGQAIIRDALAQRHAGANDRIRAIVDETLGPNVVPSRIEANVHQGQQRVGDMYRDAFREARNFDTGVITDDLDRSIQTLRGDAQRRLVQVRGMLNVHGTQQVSNNPQTLFQTRQAIDGMLTTEADPKVIGALSEVRQQLDDALRQSVPRIKEIDAQYAELARQGEALQTGQAVLDHGRTAPRPQELSAMVANGAEPQGMQVGPSAVPLRLSQGARAEVDRILGSKANDVQALYSMIKSEGDWNRSRLATLFGDEKADRLFKVLDNERLFADTNQVVTRNSETARRLAAMGEGKETNPDLVKNAVAAGGISAAPRAIGIKAADKIMNALMSGRRNAAETELAKVLSSNRSAIVEALATRQSLPKTDPRASRVAQALLLGGGVAGSR